MLPSTNILLIIFTTQISNIFTAPKADDVHLHLHLPEEEKNGKSAPAKTVTEVKGHAERELRHSESDDGDDYVDVFLERFDFFVKAGEKFNDGNEPLEESAGKVCKDKEDCKKWLKNFCSQVEGKDYYGDWFLEMFDIHIKPKPSNGGSDEDAICKTKDYYGDWFLEMFDIHIKPK